VCPPDGVAPRLVSWRCPLKSGQGRPPRDCVSRGRIWGNVWDVGGRVGGKVIFWKQIEVGTRRVRGRRVAEGVRTVTKKAVSARRILGVEILGEAGGGLGSSSHGGRNTFTSVEKSRVQKFKGGRRGWRRVEDEGTLRGGGDL